MRNSALILALALVAAPAMALDIVPRSVGTGAHQAYLDIQFQDSNIYVFNVHFDTTSATTRQMMDIVAAQLPLTYTTMFGGATLYGITYDGHTYQDWNNGFWSLWSAPPAGSPWTYSQVGWMSLSAADTQWQGLVADPGFTFKASPSPINLVTESGDFNGDGHVDGTDFLIWQRSYVLRSTTGTQWRGDGNGDGRVDGTDFLIWQRQYMDQHRWVNVAATPEPSCLAILVLGAGPAQIEAAVNN